MTRCNMLQCVAAVCRRVIAYRNLMLPLFLYMCTKGVACLSLYTLASYKSRVAFYLCIILLLLFLGGCNLLTYLSLILQPKSLSDTDTEIRTMLAEESHNTSSEENIEDYIYIYHPITTLKWKKNFQLPIFLMNKQRITKKLLSKP